MRAHFIPLNSILNLSKALPKVLPFSSGIKAKYPPINGHKGISVFDREYGINTIKISIISDSKTLIPETRVPSSRDFSSILSLEGRIFTANHPIRYPRHPPVVF